MTQKIEVEETPELRAAAKALMLCCYDPENNAYMAHELTFPMLSESGGDMGDWEIIIRPTRIPEGRLIDRRN